MTRSKVQNYDWSVLKRRQVTRRFDWKRNSPLSQVNKAFINYHGKSDCRKLHNYDGQQKNFLLIRFSPVQLEMVNILQRHCLDSLNALQQHPVVNRAQGDNYPQLLIFLKQVTFFRFIH